MLNLICHILDIPSGSNSLHRTSEDYNSALPSASLSQVSQSTASGLFYFLKFPLAFYCSAKIWWNIIYACWFIMFLCYAEQSLPVKHNDHNGHNSNIKIKYKKESVKYFSQYLTELTSFHMGHLCFCSDH